MGGWFWVSSQFAHLGYLSTVPIIIFIFCHLHHLIIIQGPLSCGRGTDGVGAGCQKRTVLSIPRAFLDTEFRRSRQSRPASGRRSSRGRAEPRVVLPRGGGAERAEGVRPRHTPSPSGLKNTALPLLAWGSRLGRSAYISPHPAASRVLTRVSPPPTPGRRIRG